MNSTPSRSRDNGGYAVFLPITKSGSNSIQNQTFTKASTIPTAAKMKETLNQVCRAGFFLPFVLR
jgi:hypothetical protein